MDLQKLFQCQKVLRDRINYNEPDRFEKLVLALLVELGECANEHRGFKFWSKDQEPRIKVLCECCLGDGYIEYEDAFGEEIIHHECANCDGTGYLDKNPLLEEYVDVLHFVLEIGLEINYNRFPNATILETDITKQFNALYLKAAVLVEVHEVYQGTYNMIEYYEDLLENFLHLGKLLGFTDEQVETAYFAKNKINHQRQTEGY